jgi:hypothetical protein
MKKEQTAADLKQMHENSGIPFERYRREELFTTIARLVVLPRYAARFLLLPVLLASIPVFIGGLYLLIQERTWDALWFLLIGAVLALLNGFLVGVIYLLRILADDLRRLTALSSRISLQILADVRSKAQDGTGTLPRFSEIARGSIIMVILPGVIRTIKGKLPLLGVFISIFAASALKRFASLAARQLDRPEGQSAAAGPGENGQKSNLHQYFETGRQKLENIISSAGSSVEISLRKASFPFKLLLAVLLPVSILVLLNLLLHGA